MKKLYRLILGLILVPFILMLGYILALLMTIVYFIINFEWDYKASLRSLNIPTIVEFVDGFRKEIKELWNE